MNRLSILNVTIKDLKGNEIFKGILSEFVEGFVFDENYFYKELKFKAVKSYPSIDMEWNNTTITLNF